MSLNTPLQKKKKKNTFDTVLHLYLKKILMELKFIDIWQLLKFKRKHSKTRKIWEGIMDRKNLNVMWYTGWDPEKRKKLSIKIKENWIK